MDSRQKAAIAGVGLVGTGIGLSLLGAALIAPAILAWTASLMQKGTGQLVAQAERASKTFGTVAGTLQRSFGEAAKAGVAEIKRGRTN